MIKIAGKRIKDRHINWQEHYSERTEPLRDRYWSELGTGSYRRWEGHDYTTNSDYYVVCSPAQTKYGEKSYFAGIKKLPPASVRETTKVYSPYGKYGVPWPKDQVNYMSAQLQNIEIPRFVKA